MAFHMGALSAVVSSLWGMAIATFKDLCIDAVDPVALGEFWAPTLGLGLTRLDDGTSGSTARLPSTPCGSTGCRSR